MIQNSLHRNQPEGSLFIVIELLAELVRLSLFIDLADPHEELTQCITRQYLPLVLFQIQTIQNNFSFSKLAANSDRASFLFLNLEPDAPNLLAFRMNGLFFNLF